MSLKLARIGMKHFGGGMLNERATPPYILLQPVIKQASTSLIETFHADPYPASLSTPPGERAISAAVETRWRSEHQTGYQLDRNDTPEAASGAAQMHAFSIVLQLAGLKAKGTFCHLDSVPSARLCQTPSFSYPASPAQGSEDAAPSAALLPLLQLAAR